MPNIVAIGVNIIALLRAIAITFMVIDALQLVFCNVAILIIDMQCSIALELLQLSMSWQHYILHASRHYYST